MICIENKPAVIEELQRVPPEQQEPTATENGKKNDATLLYIVVLTFLQI